MSLCASFARLLGRLRRDNEAVAAVEFALIAPFLLMLYLGSMEAAVLFSVDRRVNSISATIGDLVSQWDPSDKKLKTATLTDYLNASTGILSPYSTSGLAIVVSLVKVNKTTGVTSVLWSRTNANGVAKTEDQPYPGLTADLEINKVARGGCIIAAEVTYPYVPLLGQVFPNAIRLGHTNYFMPRFGSDPPIELETKSLASKACTA